MFNRVTHQTGAACEMATDAMGKPMFDVMSCLGSFADLHGVAVALCLLFAFCGAIFFVPSVIK